MAIVVGDDEIPAWATLDMSAEHCYTMLREKFKLDEDAVQDIFLLAQHSQRGHEYANMVVAKLLKKRQHHEVLRKPSAIVHVSCKNARHFLGQDF